MAPEAARILKIMYGPPPRVNETRGREFWRVRGVWDRRHFYGMPRRVLRSCGYGKK